MMGALARHGVAAKILIGLFVLFILSFLGGAVAIFSFGQVNRTFSEIASTQIKNMSDAALLRQHTQAIAALAPRLLARQFDDGAVIAFSIEMYKEQDELQGLIDQLSTQFVDSSKLEVIKGTATKLFDNTDALSTAIYSKVALQNAINGQIGELTAIRDKSRFLSANAGSASLSSAYQNWLAALDAISATVLDSIAYGHANGLAPLAADMTIRLREAASAAKELIPAEPKLQELEDRLTRVARGSGGFVTQRSQLLQVDAKIQDLFQKSERIASALASEVDVVTQGVHASVVSQNELLAETLSGRSRLVLLLGGLGLVGAVVIGVFTQLSVIGRLNRLRHAMSAGFTSSSGVPSGVDPDAAGSAMDDVGPLTKGHDEISEMARAVVSYVREISRRDEDISRSSQRLIEAIETLPGGFSLYDPDDKLVVCNTRYRELLYPGIENLVQPGQSFETVVRTAMDHGLIVLTDGNAAGWLAERVRTHRDPKNVTLQQRSDGAWIEIRERCADNGDVVSIYSDVTERKEFEAQLIEARTRAEKARELADERSSVLARLSEKLSKYLSPQVYSSIFSSKSDVAISPVRKKLTIFFSDIAGFAETTDSLESEELTDLLNHYLTEMSQIALEHGATIDKYIGDAIMVFFGDPETRGVQEDALACVTMAVAMQRRMRELEAVWRSRGIQRPFRMRIGINTGFCTVGNFGSADRMDYTIIGSEVNLAARLQAHAELGGILLAHETQALVSATVPTEELEPIAVKGFANRIRIHRVLGIHDQIDGAGNLIQVHMDGAELQIDLGRLSEADRATLGGIARNLADRLKGQR